MDKNDLSKEAGNQRGDYAIVVLAGLTALLGLVVLIGWFTHNEVLLQVCPGFVPMQFNTALGFFISGAGLLLLALWRSGWAAGS